MYSTYIVQDMDTGEWLHVGKQLGKGREKPLREAIAGKYPHSFHNKAFLMFLYSMTRDVEIYEHRAYHTDDEAKEAERTLKLDNRAERAYRGPTNNVLSTTELNNFLNGKTVECPTTDFFIKQCCLHGDIFSNVRTPINIIPKEFKCLFKI